MDKEKPLLISGSLVCIRWDDYESDGYISIEYSTNGGESFNVISSKVVSPWRCFSWGIPYINSNNCILRIKNIDGAIVRESNPFEIKKSLNHSIMVSKLF